MEARGGEGYPRLLPATYFTSMLLTYSCLASFTSCSGCTRRRNTCPRRRNTCPRPRSTRPWRPSDAQQVERVVGEAELFDASEAHIQAEVRVQVLEHELGTARRRPTLC